MSEAIIQAMQGLVCMKDIKFYVFPKPIPCRSLRLGRTLSDGRGLYA